jgi:glycosyltransferase involved in cell wall biosynthesis
LSPRVSIALCTWNGAAFLPQQLNSLLAQTHAPLELVAFDDASGDDSWAILQAYAPRFASARLARNERNLGLRTNFEQALRACRGDWIAPCDQDDVWEAHKLSRLLSAAGADTTLVYGDSLLVDEGGAPLARKPRMSDRYRMVSGSDPRLFALSNCVSGHAALVRRDVVERALPIPEGAYHDWWLAFVAANLGRVVHVDEALVRFRQHARNASGAAGQRKARPAPSAREKFEAECRNLESLAGFDGPQQGFFRELLALWRQRAQRRVTPALAAFLYRHRHAVFAMKRSSPAAKGRHALKYLPGLRGKIDP